MNRLDNMMMQTKAWLAQGLVWHQGELQRMCRAASAKALNLDPVEFSQPYPGTTNNTVISIAGLSEVLKVMENASQAIASSQTGATPTNAAPLIPVPPVPGNVLIRTAPAWLAGLAALLGAFGTYLAMRPSPPPAAPQTQGWRVRVSWVDENGKTQEKVGPIEPIDGGKE